MTALDSPTGLLHARLQVAKENLVRGKEMLGAINSKGALPSSVRGALSDLLDEQLLMLGDLRTRVGSSPSTSDWTYVRGLQCDARRLLNEALACLEAGYVRHHRLDAGLCAAADRLLHDLAATTRVPWAGATIVGDDERFIPRSQLIHLRFPEFTVWALPVTAHEFGHLVAQELSVLTPSGAKAFPLEDELQLMGGERQHYAELFADVFATWALGPAYACTAVLLRFAPDRARGTDENSTHPNDGKRVAMTVGVLDQLSREIDPISPPYSEVVTRLRRAWETALAAAGSEDIDDEAKQELCIWQERVIVPLLKHRVPESQYTGWGTALEIAETLTCDDSLSADRAPADVLNAAWRARLKYWDDEAGVKRIGDRARDMCLLAAQGSPGGSS